MIDKITILIDKIVRPYVTVLFATTICYLAIKGEVKVSELLGIGGMVFGFWFMQRQNGKEEKNVQTQSQPSPNNH